MNERKGNQVYLSASEAYSEAALSDWYQSSIDETAPPVWTDDHIKEVVRDFYLIPRDTKPADVVPATYGHYIWKDDGRAYCSKCNASFLNFMSEVMRYCPMCGIKLNTNV